LLEGSPGVGKTEVASRIATAGSLLKHHDDLVAFESLDPNEYIEPAAQPAVARARGTR
jgi:MoxR-like ATPase